MEHEWGLRRKVSHPMGNGQFNQPYGLAFDALGRVFVTDKGNHRVEKFGSIPTPTRQPAWGALKARSRGNRKQAGAGQ